jgi:ferritin
MIDMNKPIKFYAIPEINFIGTDLIEMFRQFLDAEKKVTQQWIEIRELCDKDSKYAAVCLNETIDWFLGEQIEEENEAADLLTLITKSRGDMSAILTIENRFFCDKQGYDE